MRHFPVDVDFVNLFVVAYVDKFVSRGNGLCCSGVCLLSQLKPYHHYYLEAKYTALTLV